LRTVGKELGARYVMEGSLRQAGTKLRLAVQLVDTTSGAHLWAENYERSFNPEAIFDLQDDLVPRIVSTVADRFGVLPRSMSRAVRSKATGELTPYEAVLRSFGYAERATPDEQAAAKQCMELAVERAPDDANCWATLSMLCRDEYMLGFNARPDSLDRAFSAARRAVQLEPSNHLAHVALASTHFFRKEFDSFRDAAERAMALNPMDGSSTAHLGQLMAFAGDWDRGCILAERAAQLNPQHPGWYSLAEMYNAYRTGDFQRLPALAVKVNMPGYWLGRAAVAAACGQLGETGAAANALREMLALRPDSAGIAREEIGRLLDAKLTEHLIDGLRKAGLEISG
jgi:adenylate cyclase